MSFPHQKVLGITDWSSTEWGSSLMWMSTPHWRKHPTLIRGPFMIARQGRIRCYLKRERERWTVHLEFSHPPPKRRRKREREVLKSQLTTNRISMNSTDIFLFNLSLNLREFDMWGACKSNRNIVEKSMNV